MALQHLRSSTADKRPTPAAMSDGQLALNTNLVSPGLFFKDSNGDSVKIGPVHVGTTAPNVTPGAGGQAGNSKGEAWLDTTAANPILKVFNGSAFVAVQPVGTGTVVSTTDTGTVTSTMILDGTILNADINASAGIVDTKLATIATGGKVSNSATTATNANTASAIVARDASGNFTAGTITAALTGAASSNVLKAGDTMTGVLAVTAGTAALPAITPSGDSNTGLFSPGADQLAISTNGTGRLFVDANGSVVLGTSQSPTTGGFPRPVLALKQFSDPANGFAGIHLEASGDQSVLGIGYDGTAQVFAFDTSYRGTGARRPIIFKTTGAECMRIDSSGLVGIGTSAPGGLLELSSNASATLNGEVLLQRIRSNIGNLIFVDVKSRRHTAGNNWEGVGFRLQHQVDTTAMGFIEFNSLNGGQDVAIGTGGSTRLLVTSTGNVGIGTTSPSPKLHVSGGDTTNVGFNGTTKGVRFDFDGTQSSIFGVDNTFFASYQPLRIGGSITQFMYAGAEAARIDSSGRLLVGTSTSTQTDAAVTGRLQIQSSGEERGLSQLQTSDNAAASFIQFSKIRSTSVVQNNDFLGRIQFNGYDGGNYKPAATIDALVDGTPGANDMPGRLVFSTTADGAASPTERMRINNAGTITFSAYGAGTLSTSASGVISASDGRYKTKTRQLESGLAAIAALEPTYYRWNEGSPFESEYEELGFVAQEVAAVIPEASPGEDEEGKYRNYHDRAIIAMLVKGMQEQQSIITALTARVAALEAN